MIDWKPTTSKSVDDVVRDLWRLVDSFVNEKPQFVSATDLGDATSTINTVGKYESKEVWDSTNKRILHASGSLATDAWYLDGISTITPS